MPIDKNVMKNLLDTFRVELSEHLQIMTDCVLQLEKNQMAPVRKSTFDVLFRSAHTIKGSAKSLGLLGIAEISHHLESIFSGLIDAKESVSSDVCDLFLESFDMMNTMMDEFVHGNKPSIDEKSLLEKLDQSLRGNKKPDRSASKKQKKISEKYEATYQDDKTSSSEFIRVSLDKLNDIGAIADELQIKKIELENLWIKSQRCQKAVELLLESAKRTKQLNGLSATFFSSVSEIKVLNQELARQARTLNTTVDLISLNLQDKTRMLRLVPAGTILHPLLRSSRDIAKEMNKNIDLKLTGEDIEVDRVILDLIKNSLVHLLRNAIDHGIESADVRKKLGKDPIGKVEIMVTESSGSVQISISDDGSGIDVNEVAATAIKRKLITDEDRNSLSDTNILDYIFSPGLSTKKIITELSGRGVGLDVVRSSVEKARGKIAINTKLGKGTTFTLNLPLTLVSDRGMLIKASGRLFIFPTISVVRILNIKLSDIQNVEGGQTIVLEGKPVPLHDLAGILGYKRKEFSKEDIASVIVISKGFSQIALIVDELIGEREVVIKSLQPPLEKVEFVSGATLGEKGNVILVLNPASIVELCIHKGSAVLKRSESDATNKKLKILVVDDSITTRTLEMNILTAHGYDVKSAVNGEDAWTILQKEKFDLLITDVMMPVLDGFDLTKRIKDDKTLSDLPVIIVSALANEDDKKHGIEVGADAYITKNKFETKILIDVVKQLV